MATTPGTIILLPATVITAAVSGITTGSNDVYLPPNTSKIDFVGSFTYGSSGTTAKFWVQTTIDGTNWHDIASLAYTTSSLIKEASCFGLSAHTHRTATDATLADNTVINGFLGNRLRVKYTTTGTYAGSTTIYISAIITTSTVR